MSDNRFDEFKESLFDLSNNHNRAVIYKYIDPKTGESTYFTGKNEEEADEKIRKFMEENLRS